MQVKLSRAVKMFFGNSSLEMIFIEAIANALDADATEINISINLKALNQPKTLEVEISDNGLGFTNERYSKFSKLFDVEESSHKGLGRLVYLCYFEEVKVTSYFENINFREFDFSEKFTEKDSKVSLVDKTESGSIFKMTNYALEKIAKNEYIQADYLKVKILQEFISRLFYLKNRGKNIIINFKTNIDNIQINSQITNVDIPEFKIVNVESHIDLFDKFHLHYSITEVELNKSSFIAAISVDNRTVKVDIVAEENIPQGYNMIFLLFSSYFDGKVDLNRQNLTISKTELKEIQSIFRKKVANIIEEFIPKIKSRNKETKNGLINKYPHLSGYFDSENIGYISRNHILEKAQEEFFKSQKELLEANVLSDEQFEKALEVSSRSLTEYILFRQLTIDNLKNSTNKNSEAELHKLFATKRKEGKFEKSNFVNDLYRNNSWLLDDKFMTYESMLSDREFGELIDFITEGEKEKNEDRIDIALVFSNNPENKKPFDIVIVELKKRGLSLEENMKVITQLEKRARKLMKYYDNQIQRIWFYGIIEFNEEVELALAAEYKPLYSSGKMYYKETPVAISLNPTKTLPASVYIWDLDAVINDAQLRNSAFLNLIKSKFTTQS
ncbi:MAG: ATP-binding protein [Bacteroidetes bacterium]|nr:MAG: ATP-binding protein [Bacteroidota bacterium]